jgi:N-acetylmuramoyl-L-alanine amidase
MENATSTKNISDLSSILNDLLKNAKINESSRLAGFVQSSLVKHLNRKGYDRIRDKGVKQAPFYVLLGARMPSILVGTSFISNREECRRLTSAAYQEHLAEGIIAGLRGYIQEISPTAFSQPPAGDSG